VRIVMIGPPGAGKGTQAKLLRERLGVPQISTGDMLRAAERRGTIHGREAARYMRQGQLVPDDVVIGIVDERLAAGDCQSGFILDGFPRTVEQARSLDTLLVGRGESLDAVLSIEVSTPEVVRRLGGRLICRSCSTPYHDTFNPPRDATRCDHCAGELYQRDDDREDRIRLRLDEQLGEMGRVVEHYRTAGVLHEIDGVGSQDEIFDRLTAALA